MIATIVATRGLDVKELELVINYDVLNDYEDNLWCCRTDNLKALADSFTEKVNQGLELAHEYGSEGDKSDSEDEDEGIRKEGGNLTLVSSAQLLPAGRLPVA
ncbi:hypothetical protein K7X08_038079 [Anisodus acutangulus]|uniref:Uncharacterized protein n=1 Tax=Anisodus acutangulus TaxID=402998 RepID=A0A9Q1RQ00_9SOLA|nr:hypothetical protein K7X08_038079 [Anisodus acutangulus]